MLSLPHELCAPSLLASVRPADTKPPYQQQQQWQQAVAVAMAAAAAATAAAHLPLWVHVVQGVGMHAAPRHELAEAKISYLVAVRRKGQQRRGTT